MVVVVVVVVVVVGGEGAGGPPLPMFFAGVNSTQVRSEMSRYNRQIKQTVLKAFPSASPRRLA